MLRFQWDALRVGDHVLVHDDAERGLSLALRRDGLNGPASAPSQIGQTGVDRRPLRRTR